MLPIRGWLNFWGLVEDLKEGTYKILVRSEHRKYLNQEFQEMV